MLQTIYELLENGFRASETTHTAFDASGEATQSMRYDWTYDELGRLVREVLDHYDDALDYDTRYVYDLVGNRLAKETLKTIGDVARERVEYAYDVNDRLWVEQTFFDNLLNNRTDYVWGADGRSTEQTGKVVSNAQGVVTSTTTMTYDLRGRLCELVIETRSADNTVSRTTQEYVYDESGIKVRQTEVVHADVNDPNAARVSDTTYLVDFLNHTGYAQVLEEYTKETTTTAADGTVTTEKTITYTIGHDVLSQFSNAMREAIAAAGGTGASLYFLYDGHGSTRAVTDATGQIVQRYDYDAYGNAHGFDPKTALTNLLYSGEQANPTSGLQYLRARWYNPNIGRFGRVDPFSGLSITPQTLHKYAYSINNPIMGSDPSGEFPWALALGIGGGLTALYWVSRQLYYNPSASSKEYGETRVRLAIILYVRKQLNHFRVNAKPGSAYEQLANALVPMATGAKPHFESVGVSIHSSASKGLWGDSSHGRVIGGLPHISIREDVAIGWPLDMLSVIVYGELQHTPYGRGLPDSLTTQQELELWVTNTWFRTTSHEADYYLPPSLRHGRGVPRDGIYIVHSDPTIYFGRHFNVFTCPCRRTGETRR